MAVDKILEGTLFVLSETGYEKCPWAIQCGGAAGQDGVRVLRPGDKLTIYNKHDRVVFEGVILIGKERCGLFRLNWYPKGINKERWVGWFAKEYRARIVRGVPDEIARLVGRAMSWEGYLAHIESSNKPLKGNEGYTTVTVACYFPDSKRKPTRLDISFTGGIVSDIRPL